MNLSIEHIDHLLHDPDFLASVASFGAVAVVVLIWFALVESDPLPARLKNVTERRAELREEQKKKKQSRLVGNSQADKIRHIVQKLKLEQGRKLDELRIKLAQAGFRSRDTLFAFVLLKTIFPIATGVTAAFFIYVLHSFNLKPIMEILAVLVSAGVGLYLPDVFIKNQSQKRVDILRKGLPDGLDLLVICAEAGLSLDSSLDRVSREMGPTCPELAEEIGLTAVELSFFPERPKALQNLAERVPLPGVLALTNTLIQTEKYGTPLAQALRVMSSELRNERMMSAEAKAAKLPATLTVPMMLFILPPLFVVLIGPAALKVMGLNH